VSEADLALALTVAAGVALRGAGLWLGGALRAESGFIAWASAVSVATLAAFVALAVAAPSGLLATVPLAARLAGLAGGWVGYLAFGRRLLPAMGTGLGTLVAVRAVVG
jgi:hypothetical protein